MPGCNGQDKAKDRQGKPVKMEVNGCGEESRGWSLGAGAPLSRHGASALSESTGPTGKRSARKRACSVWSGGKAAKPYLSLPGREQSRPATRRDQGSEGRWEARRVFSIRPFDPLENRSGEPAVFIRSQQVRDRRQGHHELLRSAVLDVTPIIPATACHQRNYVERYSRYILTIRDHT
jgi:hypothetical protein